MKRPNEPGEGLSSVVYYRALVARDARFDGLFFVGVTSTGIYCRPICTARTPRESHCRFFANAMVAEREGFRPCLRCRPELAPGLAPIDGAHRVAHLVVQRVEEDLMADGGGLERIAAGFNLSSRQLRRIVQDQLGVSPIQLILTRRLLLAKQMLTETKLPVIDVAFASGFASLRRFNDAFRSRYGMPPSRLRREVSEQSHPPDGNDTSIIQLSYRPPYDWDGTLRFLAARMLKGAEWITGDAYMRTVALGRQRGWIRVVNAADKNSLLVEFTHSLAPVLPRLLGRLRSLFDLTARPDLIAQQLRKDVRLRLLLMRNKGLRVPGAFDGFELAVRAILGQQVTVKGATTLACRFIAAFGAGYSTPITGLTHLSPPAERVARASVEEIASLGIISARARSIIALAQAVVSEVIQLEPGANPHLLIAQLQRIPGIGPWTAHYIAMRALRWPDAFPKEDVALLNCLGGVTPKEAEQLSQQWRPWRSYAVLHLWRSMERAPRSRTSNYL